MQLFEFSSDWADFVIAQLSATHRTLCTEKWGYACLVMGEGFEQALVRNWYEVNLFAGPYLHLFALVPPPYDFVLAKVLELRKEPASEERDFALAKYERLLERKSNWENLKHQKVTLRKQLLDWGLNVPSDTDFVFMGFHNQHGKEVHIDFVAAKSAAIKTGAGDRQYLDCIERMARIARSHYDRNSPLAEVIKEISFPWTLKIAFEKGSEAFKFVKKFIVRMPEGG